MPEDTIYNGCGDKSQDSFCTRLEDKECPNRNGQGETATCRDCISNRADIILN